MNEMLERALHDVGMLPEEEVLKARQAIAPPEQGRWARLAERLSRESPLEGRSEEFLERGREFRHGFMFVEPKNVD